MKSLQSVAHCALATIGCEAGLAMNSAIVTREYFHASVSRDFIEMRMGNVFLSNNAQEVKDRNILCIKILTNCSSHSFTIDTLCQFPLLASAPLGCEWVLKNDPVTNCTTQWFLRCGSCKQHSSTTVCRSKPITFVFGVRYYSATLTYMRNGGGILKPFYRVWPIVQGMHLLP